MAQHRLRQAASASVSLAALLVAIIVPLPTSGAEGGGKQAGIPVTIEIRNRLYPKFYEKLETTMHKRQHIGDTDYSFEIIEFFPHFAIVDSTKATISLSEEAKNAAFKIRVYKNDEVLEDTWAFYHIDIPHFDRTSFLAFKVVAFEYRGEVFSKDKKEDEEK